MCHIIYFCIAVYIILLYMIVYTVYYIRILVFLLLIILYSISHLLYILYVYVYLKCVRIIFVLVGNQFSLIIHII